MGRSLCCAQFPIRWLRLCSTRLAVLVYLRDDLVSTGGRPVDGIVEEGPAVTLGERRNALATFALNKPYLGLTRKPWDPVLFGLFLMAVAILVKRWLASGSNGQRYGFTPVRLLAGDRKIMTAIGTASSLLQPDMPASGASPASPQPQFGGGRSGGAGASGEF